ncbi:MAG: putative bifunctional diguanylate cyclase/phosphodiesterase [Acidimicrobiales bacterium]
MGRTNVRQTVRSAAREFRRPTLDITETGFIEPLFLQRYAAVGALGVLASIFVESSRALPFLILGFGFAANLAAHLRARATGRVPIWMYYLDLIGLVAIALMEPRALLPAVMVLLTVVSLAASVSGTSAALVATALGVLGVLVNNAVHPFDSPGLLAAAFGVTGAMIAVAVGHLANLEDRVRTRLNLVVDNLDAILWVREPVDDRFTFVNQRAVTLLGWSEQQWLAPGFWAANVHPEDRRSADDAIARGVVLGIEFETNYRFRASDGRWVHLHDRVTITVDGTGRPIALQGVSIDVTGRVDIERRVNQFADIVDRIDLALLVLCLDEEGDDPGALRLQAANPAAARLIRRDLHPLLGATIEEALPALAGSLLRDRVTQVVHRGVPLRVDDLIVAPPGGERRVVTLRAFPLPERSVAVSLQDITDAVQASEALRRQALYDQLTGLPNRRLFDQELHRALRDAPLGGDRVALLVMDLDQFKEVNDALGHHVGDQLLRAIGVRLSEAFADDLVARLGGDEFALVLAGQVDEAAAVAIAGEVRKVLSEPFVFDDIRIQSNASIGIALYPEHAEDVATLIRRSDVAMYLAKRSGTGSAVYAAEHDRSSIERLTLIGDLPEAVATGQFELHFQPCVDLRTGRTVRAEALIRWNHPRLGRIGPDQFIGLAEVSGSIQPITRWVVHHALQAAASWRAAGHDVGLAVNLSVRNLYDPDLVAHLERELAAVDVPPRDLIVELTETQLMDDPRLAREVFTAIGDLGVQMSVDDFGTGYSSLTYLRDLPLQEIKVDRSFVSGMHRRSEEFTIVRSMIDLGHNLGLEVVAEGVEHADDLAMLRHLGCDLAQGYHLSVPLSLPEMIEWLGRPAHPLPEPARM